ncbi:hypothetical protein F-liban_262 [Faustovirus]|nr:hypothetical protein F-liban_262 [Faustovirus]
MNWFCRAVLVIGLYGIGMLCFYMYHYSTMGLFEIDLEKCKDKPKCEITASVSGWGAFSYAFALIFLSGSVASIAGALAICYGYNGHNGRNVNTTPTTTPTTATNAKKPTTEETVVAQDAPGAYNASVNENKVNPTNPFVTTVELDEMI